MTPTQDRVLRAIEACLLAYPGMRICQAIFNALPDGRGEDVFYVTDEELAAVLEDYARRFSSEPKGDGA